ncbi:MAG: FAD-dependent oxidoreductase [Acidimicrobiales bacterium]
MSPAGGMDSAYDVVVVGARCAGASLATHLARAGWSVAVLDAAARLGDTASTHFVAGEGVACLGRLGVVPQIRATGAPWIESAKMRVGDLSVGVPWPRRPTDPGPAICVRRHLLDPLLAQAARQAGAQVALGTRVTDLITDSSGRVGGVRTLGGDIRASLVVGADGRSSLVARRVGARRYHVVPNQRMAWWGYFSGTQWEPPAALVTQRWNSEFMVACPTDSGLYLVISYPPLDRKERFVADPETEFAAAVDACPAVAEIVAGGRLEDQSGHKVRGITRCDGYFRQSSGPGWALVGDAGHFKDPAPGQGISDALRQAEALALALVAAATPGSAQGGWSATAAEDGVIGGAGALGGVRAGAIDRATGAIGGAGAIDRATGAWACLRDADEVGMHWFAADMGRGGPVPRVLAEIVRGRLGHPGGAAEMFDVFNHRVAPAQVLTGPRLAAATGRLLRSGSPPGAVLAEVAEVTTRELGRRIRNRWPTYSDVEPKVAARDG